MLQTYSEDVGAFRGNSSLAKTPRNDVLVLLSLVSKFVISNVFNILNRVVVENVAISIYFEYVLKFRIDDDVNRSN